ncbi:MAG: DUF6502 family protein, partial [Gammaproteobacteria bacterium]|nr:DUF6502 family protein [Gammaproteobacteria bacterium]
MSDSKGSATAALRLLFRPVARIMLRAGINWQELAEVCKATYVEVATEDFGIRGRPTNISRVAILTGLTRREVRRLRKLLQADDPETFNRMNYATRVLSGWYQDEEFLGADARPVPLPADGASRSFASLCAKYSGDVAATTMLKELKHVGAVVETDDGLLAVRTRYYMPTMMDPERMLSSGSVLEDMGYTVAYNLHRSEEDPGRFERRATNTRMPADAVPEFREFMEKKGQAFLEEVDAWLSEHEIEDGNDEKSIRLGLGAYWIEG